MKTYILYILIAIDQLFNTILLGAPDETLSSRCYRSWRDRKGLGIVLKPVIDTLLWFDKNHCEESYKAELYKRQYPKDFI